MQITYKPIRHGYARIDKDGNLLITIPLSKKWKEFETIMIEKGQKLLNRYNKKTHIDPIQQESIVLFGEQVPIKNFDKQYPPKKNRSNCPIVPSFHRSTVLKEILKEYTIPILEVYSQKLWIAPTKLSFRKTISKRWSCTYDQKISLNIDLVHLPTKYIKYVIIHEACHLKIKNHSKKFRDLVETFCPDYKNTKKELRKFVFSNKIHK